MKLRFDVPPFEPHPLLRDPHAQTIAGSYLPGPRFPYQAVRRPVHLPDGDTIILHDDCPSDWPAGGPAALLLHGLAGCHLSTYMVRIAAKLKAAGVRAFRMDLRGCGAGRGLASRPYHAGRSEDARAALEMIQSLCPASPVTLIGFSLSGNTVLKLLGEAPEAVPSNVEKAAAVSPALDLAFCVGSLVGPLQKVYDRHFVRLLCQQVRANSRLRPDLAPLDPSLRLKTLYQFDDAYTGPVCGFGTAKNYYATNSAARHVGRIRIPTLVVASRDDPLVPIACLERLEPPSSVLFHVTEHGGHLGYVGKGGTDPDRRWLDWRIVEWVQTDVGLEETQRLPSERPVTQRLS